MHRHHHDHTILQRSQLKQRNRMRNPKCTFLTP